MSHKTTRWLIVATTLALCAAPTLAADQAHQHEGHGAATPTLNNGQKWPTDAPLRQAMAGIQTALQPKLQAIHENKLTAAQYRTLAKQTNTQIAFMVANCKLAPEADAQLHLIIAELGAAAEAMSGKDKTQSRQNGAVRLQHALETYGTYFDHPGGSVVGATHKH